MAEKPQVVARTVTATFVNGDEIHVDDGTGQVSVYLDPVMVVRDIRAFDRKASKKTNAIFATSIQWSNLPPGFKAPK